MRLFNFLTRKKEPFKPFKDKRVKMYTCGPTVYNFAHIGNLRTFIFEDILRRTLELAGYEVKQVMNITNVDDKIIKGAAAAKKDIYAFAKPFEKAFFNDTALLNIKPAFKYPKATKHIKEMVALIQQLLKRGLAYESGGSIYFDISRFSAPGGSASGGKKYGRLSRLRTSHVRKIRHRIDVDEYAKADIEDFALWKKAKRGEPSWSAKFKFPRNPETRLPGRPGWHIECSAMSMKYLGQTFDIHAGGVDLLFPHHENEIAQSEGATGKTFARYFVEGEHLLVEGQKMSKSLGNIYTLRDIEKRGFDPLVFRYLVLTSHYRSKLNFTWKSLKAARTALEKIRDRVLELKYPNKSLNQSFRLQFTKAVNDDLDTPKALAVFWKNFNKLLLADFLWADRILGLNLASPRLVRLGRKTPTAKIKKLVKEREKYRGIQNWKKADEIRAKIRKMGWQIEDTPQGPALKKL